MAHGACDITSFDLLMPIPAYVSSCNEGSWKENPFDLCRVLLPEEIGEMRDNKKASDWIFCLANFFVSLLQVFQSHIIFSHFIITMNTMSPKTTVKIQGMTLMWWSKEGSECNWNARHVPDFKHDNTFMSPPPMMVTAVYSIPQKEWKDHCSIYPKKVHFHCNSCFGIE